MRDDIQHRLQSWLNSPEHAHYVDTLCAAQDSHADELTPARLPLRSLAHQSNDQDETTQTLVMIDINALPAEMRANLGATAEDADMDSCGTVA